MIGEVVRRLDSTLTAQYELVTWDDFIGFRNVLINQYHKVRLDLVWDFAQEGLPAFKAAVMALLTDLEDAESPWTRSEVMGYVFGLNQAVRDAFWGGFASKK